MDYEVQTDSKKVCFQRFLEKPTHSLIEKGILLGLSLLALIYSLGIRLRVFLYQAGLFKTTLVSVPVVSVGNLTMGGTGKTPLVEMLARQCVEQGKKVAILTRGYSRRSRNRETPQKVQIDPKIPWTEQAQNWGDEPLMLASRLPKVVVIVGKNRVQGAHMAIQKFGAEILLLDDGFQHLKIKRDLNLLVVDAQKGFQGSRLLPRGFLREPISALSRATAIVFTQQKGEIPKELEQQIRKWNPLAPHYSCQFEPTGLFDFNKGCSASVDSLKGKKVFLFCGIGRPESFEQTCQTLGLNVTESFRFADHHYFSKKELTKVWAQAKEKKSDAVLTTEKDLFRLPPDFPFESPPLFILQISARSPSLEISQILPNK